MTGAASAELQALVQSVLMALQQAKTQESDGGQQEIAAQKKVHGAARALMDHLVAHADGQATLQIAVTVACNALCKLAGLYAAAARHADATAALNEAEATAAAHADTAVRSMVAVGIALREADMLRGDGGPKEIAALERVHGAARAQIDHLIAGAADQDAFQSAVTADCNALCMLAGLYAAAGRRAEAAAALSEAEATAAAHGDATRRMLVAVDIADAALTQGAFSRALAALLAERERLPASLDLTAQISPHIKVGVALAQVFNWLGDVARAEAEIARTEAQLRVLMAQQAADAGQVLAFFRSHDAINLHYQRAMVLLDSGDFAAAALAFDTVEPTYAEIDPASAAAMRYYRAKIAAGRGDPDAAVAILDEIRPAFDTLPKLKPKRGTLRSLRARILLDAGRGAEALEDAATGAALESEAGTEETVWNAHWQHARALDAVAGANPMPAYNAAIASLDHLRAASLGYRLDNLYLRTRRPMVDQAVAAAAARGDAVRCLRYADAVKSRFLAAALAAGPPPTPDPALAARLDALSAAIDAGARAEGQDDHISTLVAERAALLERMRLDRGALATPALEIASLLEGLQARGQAALQLYLAGGRVTAVLLYEGELHLDTLDLTEATSGALAIYANNLRLERPSRLDFDPARRGLDAAALVPVALLERACSARSLLVSPHGKLNILPWPALPFARQRLFELVPVAIVPNIAAIPALAARPPTTPRAGLFGDPTDAALTAAERPAQLGPGIAALAALYGQERLVARPVVQGEATLAGFRSLTECAGAEAQGRPILHLACHGAFEFDDPAGSGLKLADRRLTAAELALRPLPFGEVTMAACSTGVRPDRVGDVHLFGDDILGLPASLLETGARSVLVSTTVAGVQASEAFFTAYHAQRLDGADALTACAATQRALLADGRHKLRDWIGFTLYTA